MVISVKISDEELINLIQKQRLDEDETHKFMQHIVSAVDHLHKAGIIHRYTPRVSFSSTTQINGQTPRPPGAGSGDETGPAPWRAGSDSYLFSYHCCHE